MTGERPAIADDDLRPPKLVLADETKAKKVEQELAPLVYGLDVCQRVKRVFREEMSRGIRSEPSSLQMAHTHVSEFPDGTERGKYLALDLGGTNFRILLVEIESGRIADVDGERYPIAEEARLGPGEDLFDYLADRVSDFLGRRRLEGRPMPLGFAFSFPTVQRDLKSAFLVKWTKSFGCSGVEGEDVARLLQEALSRKNCRGVSVKAVLNDTTGTLITGRSIDKNTCVGLVLGTGCNACYVEKAERRESTLQSSEVVIDIEWGALGDNGLLDFIGTNYDSQADDDLAFEKYVSGKYLGEIARAILVTLADKGLVFGGNLGTALLESGSFSSSALSEIEECFVRSAPEAALRVLESLGARDATAEDLAIVHHVCRCVSNRSALLASVCLADLLDRIDEPEATVAVDGSLYRNHPRYRFLVRKYLGLFTEKKFTLTEVPDGSGRGAALLAAVVTRLEGKSGELSHTPLPPDGGDSDRGVCNSA